MLGVVLFSGPFEPLSSYMFRFIWLLPFLLLSAHRAHIPNWDRFSPSCEVGAGAELSSLPALFPRLGKESETSYTFSLCQMHAVQSAECETCLQAISGRLDVHFDVPFLRLVSEDFGRLCFRVATSSSLLIAMFKGS